MTRKEAIDFGEDRLGLFGGKMEEFIEQSLEALREAEQEPKTGYISIDNVMSVFDDFMCGNVDEDGIDTFLAMLKDKAESEET